MVCFGSSLSLRLDSMNGSIVSRVQQLLEMISSDSERRMFHTSLALIVWNIWKNRNEYVFKGTHPCPSLVISSYKSSESEFYSISPLISPNVVAMTHDESQATSLRWIPPTNNCVKLNCDASFKTTCAALGVIARDSVGQILLCSGEKWRASDPLMAELLAIRNASQLVITHGWQNATIESDSKAAIFYVSSDAPDPPWNVAAIVTDIRMLASQVDLSFSWVKSDCNLAAHYVAKVAFKSHVNFIWDANFPVEITSIARSDLAY